MEQGKGIWERLRSQDSQITPVPLIEIAGDRRILIEHHRGVKQYSRDRIAVAVKYGQVVISGCGMELSRMQKDQLVICGQIDSISIVRRR